MSYHRGYATGKFEEHLGSKTSRRLEKAKSKERQKEEANKKLRSSDDPRRSNDKFVSDDQYTSSPGKHCVSVAKNPTNILQSPSLPLAENSALARAKGCDSLYLCTESNLKTESWKKPDEQEKAREMHQRKFQATLASLLEEFERGAFVTRIQNMKTLRVQFIAHYVTHSPRQILAVTGDHHILGAWKSFVPLRRAEDGFWFCTVILPTGIQVEWKFILVEDGKIERWEECRNRQLKVPGKVEDEEIQLCCTWGYH